MTYLAIIFYTLSEFFRKLLELIVKCELKKIIEIPIAFQKRLYGSSKLSLKEQILYLMHIRRLFFYKYRTLAEFIQFLVIGCIGAVIDLFFVFISYDLLSVQFRSARIIGFVFALTNNFLLNRYLTFKDARSGNIMFQYIRFFIIAIIAFVINWVVSVFLYEKNYFFTKYYLLAALAGIISGMTINFLGSKFFVFSKNIYMMQRIKNNP